MNRVVVIALAVVVAIIALLAAAPFLIPASQYRTSIEQGASDALGRDVKVSGPLRFSVFPNLGVTAQQVSIANAPGGKAPLFANIDELDVAVALTPLLRGDVQVSKLILKKPQLALEADVNGKPNWAFEPKLKPGETPKAQDQAQLDKVGLGDVRVENGALTYRDNLGKVQALSALDAKVALKNLDSPFTLVSDFTYGGDPVKLTLDAPAPRAFEQKKQTALNLVLESPKLTAKMHGFIDPADFTITGKLDANGPSIRKLSAWVGSPIGEGGGMQNFSVIGDLKAQGPVTTLTNATLTIDKLHGHGDIEVSTPPAAPPYVKGAVTIDSLLDVNTYLGPPPAPVAAAAGAPAKGMNVNQGWDNTKIDLSGIKALNADLALTTGQVLFQKIKIDRAHINIAIKDGVMRADLTQMALYGGSGSGVMTLDARAPALRLQQDLSVDGLSAKPFLTDAMGMDKIEGATKFVMSVAGQGGSQQQIMNTLGGKANFTFTNGALTGINLAQVARQIQSALTGAAVGPAAKTDFAEMGATFAIASGVAHTNDFHLLNPFIRISGAGDLNLARQSMDMKITPTVVKSAEGQGGAASLGGLSVPFHVTGPWAKLSFAPDLSGLLQSKVSDQLGKVLGNKSGGGLPDLGSLFGKKKP